MGVLERGGMEGMRVECEFGGWWGMVWCWRVSISIELDLRVRGIGGALKYM